MAIQLIGQRTPKQDKSEQKQKYNVWDDIERGLNVASKTFGMAVDYQKFNQIREDRAREEKESPLRTKALEADITNKNLTAGKIAGEIERDNDLYPLQRTAAEADAKKKETEAGLLVDFGSKQKQADIDYTKSQTAANWKKIKEIPAEDNRYSYSYMDRPDPETGKEKRYYVRVDKKGESPPVDVADLGFKPVDVGQARLLTQETDKLKTLVETPKQNLFKVAEIEDLLDFNLDDYDPKKNAYWNGKNWVKVDAPGTSTPITGSRNYVSFLGMGDERAPLLKAAVYELKNTISKEQFGASQTAQELLKLANQLGEGAFQDEAAFLYSLKKYKKLARQLFQERFKADPKTVEEYKSWGGITPEQFSINQRNNWDRRYADTGPSNTVAPASLAPQAPELDAESKSLLEEAAKRGLK